ncbi:MAG: type III polyketide synthase [Bacteroidia bacterium]
MSHLKAIHTAVPPHAINTEAFVHFVQQQSAASNTDLRKLRWLASRSGIDSRYAVIPDYHQPAKAELYYKNQLPHAADIVERMAIYRRKALELSMAACSPVLQNQPTPTHLIYTSCTGLSAPGIDVDLLRALNLPATTFRHTVNFMGCYAALHALRTAHYICSAEPDAVVLLLCTELCSLHYQNALHDDALLANLLFGDGSAALLIAGAAHAEGALLHFNGFQSALLPGGETDMSWELSPLGFEMRLSSYVPSLLNAHLAEALGTAWQKWGIQQEQIGHWALHPGGKSILELLQQSLTLTDSQMEAAYSVLNQYGNMSSATVLFVLQQLLKQQPLAGDKVLLAAFGPGLCMELGWGECSGLQL